MPEVKRKSLIEVTEKNYPKADEALSIIGAYKARHRLPTMIDALLEMVKKADEFEAEVPKGA